MFNILVNFRDIKYLGIYKGHVSVYFKGYGILGTPLYKPHKLCDINFDRQLRFFYQMDNSTLFVSIWYGTIHQNEKGFKATGLGAKSQILSSVAPPRKKKLAAISSQEHVWGPQKPMFY